MSLTALFASWTKINKGCAITDIKTIIASAASRIKAIRKVHWITFAAGISTAGLIVYFYPQNIAFSYDSATCIGHLHMAPKLLSSDSQKFSASSASIMKLGSIEAAAQGICFNPLSAPEPGDYDVGVAFAPLPFITKIVKIHVPEYPVVAADQLSRPLPLAKNLVIGLSETDKVFTYRLTVGKESVECSARSQGVECDIGALGLIQGKKYDLTLDRYFNGRKVERVLAKAITTLPAVSLVSSTIRQGKTVYGKPRSVALTFDKEISNAEVSLVRMDGDKQEVAIQHIIKAKTVTLKWTKDLERRQSYRINLNSVVASDGSSLAIPSSISFKMSGGPKVKSISIGTYKVPLGSVATLVFDQPLAKDQDISTVISIAGGAKIVGRQGAEVAISFAGVPRCRTVTITVGDNLKSNYGISGGSSWRYSTRTICQSVFSIGNSVRGRAIYAYSFGSGSKTIVYTGAIHGDEASTRSLMLRWIDALEASPGSIPSNKRVIVIPAVNPDGYAYGTRTNAHNVDLNRNFDTADWTADITTVTNKPFPGGGGSAPLSEPESAALASYIAAVRPALVLSYHSIGGLVIANQAGGSSQFAKRYAALSGYANSTGSSDTFDYAISGTADDYYAQRLGVASIVVELGSHTYHQYERNRAAMWAILRET